MEGKERRERGKERGKWGKEREERGKGEGGEGREGEREGGRGKNLHLWGRVLSWLVLRESLKKKRK